MGKLTKEEYYNNAREIYDFFLSVRFTPAQAAGMLAQADAESSLDPTAVGDNSKATGLYQLHPDRVAVICNGNKQYPGCGIRVTKDSPISAQLEAVWWELRHSEKHAFLEILATTTAYDAGYAACKYYLRPASAAQADKRGIKAEGWLKYFADNSNTVVANDTANTAASNNTVRSAGKYSNDEHLDVEELRKNSVVAKANNANKDTYDTANTDTADSIPENISNVNFFDPELRKAPDETTYLDTKYTSNTANLNRKLTENSKVVKDHRVGEVETVNTATSTISVNTLENYANADPANTVPKNSNRDRVEGEPHEDDFVTPLSNKTDEAREAEEIENGERQPTDDGKSSQDSKKVSNKTEKGSSKEKSKDKEDKETLAEKAERENDHETHDTSREYYTGEEKDPSTSNTVTVEQQKFTQA